MSGVVEFKGPDWGKSLHHGIEAGATLGKGLNSAIASMKYSSAKDAANEAFEKDIAAAGNDQKAIDLAHTKRDKAMGQALSDVYAFTGEYEKSHNAQRQTDQNAALAELKQGALGQGALPQQAPQALPQYDAKGAEAFKAELMAGYQKDPTAANNAILKQINADPLRKSQGVSYSLTDSGQYQAFQNGKPMGNPENLPDGLLNSMVGSYFDDEVAARYGTPENPIAAGGVGAVGPTEPAADNGGKSYRDQYNTKLSEKDEAEYQKWAKRTGRANDDEDYDMRGAWLEAKEKGISLENEKGHFPDKYKKPNHPTFSNESKYNGAEGARGGTWSKTSDGRPMYTPGRDLSDEEAQKLQKYFAEKEPDAVLNLQGRQSQQRPQAMITADNAPQQGRGQRQAMDIGPDAVMRRQRPEGYSNDLDYVIRREREMAQIQDRFFARYGRYPDNMEKSQLLDAIKQRETGWHNVQTEDTSRETNAIARGNLRMREKEFEFKKQQAAAEQLAAEIARLNPKLKVSDTGSEEEGYEVKNEQGMTVGRVMSLDEKGNGTTSQVVAPPGWTKKQVSELNTKIQKMYGSTRGVEYTTDPQTLHTTIKIGDNLFGFTETSKGVSRSNAFQEVADFLASVEAEVSAYKKSTAGKEDKAEAGRRAHKRRVEREGAAKKKRAELQQQNESERKEQKRWRDD